MPGFLMQLPRLFEPALPPTPHSSWYSGFRLSDPPPSTPPCGHGLFLGSVGLWCQVGELNLGLLSQGLPESAEAWAKDLSCKGTVWPAWPGPVLAVGSTGSGHGHCFCLCPQQARAASSAQGAFCPLIGCMVLPPGSVPHSYQVSSAARLSSKGCPMALA